MFFGLVLGLGEEELFSLVLGCVPSPLPLAQAPLGTPSPSRSNKALPCALLASVPCSYSSLRGLMRRGNGAKTEFGNYQTSCQIP